MPEHSTKATGGWGALSTLNEILHVKHFIAISGFIQMVIYLLLPLMVASVLKWFILST